MTLDTWCDTAELVFVLIQISFLHKVPKKKDVGKRKYIQDLGTTSMQGFHPPISYKFCKLTDQVIDFSHYLV